MTDSGETSQRCRRRVAVAGCKWALTVRRAEFRRAILDFTPSRWFHVVFNYLGPDDGYQVYHDGILVADRLGIIARPSVTAIDTKIVIGRRFTEVDDFYSSIQMDELLFFNYVLGDDDVKQLSR